MVPADMSDGYLAGSDFRVSTLKSALHRSMFLMKAEFFLSSLVLIFQPFQRNA